jgi:hypothetical protein
VAPDNPYEPSQTPILQAQAVHSDSPISMWPAIRQVFISWEKLRIVYDMILVATCLIYGRELYPEISFWLLCFFGGIFCNLCFFLGPIVESYATWLLQRDQIWLRVILFIAGLAISLGGAIFEIHLLRFPITMIPNQP